MTYPDYFICRGARGTRILSRREQRGVISWLCEYTFNSRDELNRAEAWLKLKGADAPLPPPDTFQLAPDVGVVRAVSMQSHMHDGPSLTHSLPNPAPSIPRLPGLPLPKMLTIDIGFDATDLYKDWHQTEGACRRAAHAVKYSPSTYCVANHTGMEDCCPDCGRDPEARKTMMIHNGAETEGCYVTCPKGCQSTGPFHRPELAWGQWHAKCRERI